MNYKLMDKDRDTKKSCISVFGYVYNFFPNTFGNDSYCPSNKLKKKVLGSHTLSNMNPIISL